MNNSMSKAVRFNNTSHGYIDNSDSNSNRYLKNMHVIKGIATQNITPLSGSYRNRTSDGNLNTGGVDDFT